MAMWRATLVLSATVCGVFGADQPGSQQAVAALQPALMSARTGPCTEDDHCGDHGVCLIDEGSCFCDLGFSGRTCADPSVKDTVRGSSDKGYWTNLTLGNVRTGGGGGGGGGGGSPMVGLLGGPTATANNWFNPFAASTGAYNRVAASAVLAVEFLFELGIDYDRLPISVTLDIDAFSEMKKILPKHRPVNYQNIKGHKCTSRGVSIILR